MSPPAQSPTGPRRVVLPRAAGPVPARASSPGLPSASPPTPRVARTSAGRAGRGRPAARPTAASAASRRLRPRRVGVRGLLGRRRGLGQGLLLAGLGSRRSSRARACPSPADCATPWTTARSSVAPRRPRMVTIAGELPSRRRRCTRARPSGRVPRRWSSTSCWARSMRLRGGCVELGLLLARHGRRGTASSASAATAARAVTPATGMLRLVACSRSCWWSWSARACAASCSGVGWTLGVAVRPGVWAFVGAGVRPRGRVGRRPRAGPQAKAVPGQQRDRTRDESTAAVPPRSAPTDRPTAVGSRSIGTGRVTIGCTLSARRPVRLDVDVDGVEAGGGRAWRARRGGRDVVTLAHVRGSGRPRGRRQRAAGDRSSAASPPDTSPRRGRGQDLLGLPRRCSGSTPSAGAGRRPGPRPKRITTIAAVMPGRRGGRRPGTPGRRRPRRARPRAT